MTVLAAMTRDLTVTYGSFALSEANGITLNAADGSYRMARSYTPESASGSFSCEFTLRLLAQTGVQATDDALMDALVQAVETNLHMPRQRLQARLGSGALHDWNPAAGIVTAFRITPSIEKVGDRFDSGRAQKYRFGVSCGFPADLVGQGLRQSSNTQFTITINGRRTTVITGVWTADRDGPGYANYLAAVADGTFFASRLPTPVSGGEWVLVEEIPNFDDESFGAAGGAINGATRTYWEVVNGLREYVLDVKRGTNKAATVTFSGVYTSCAAHASAQDAYNADAFTRSVAFLTAAGGNYPPATKPSRRVEDANTTDQRFSFSLSWDQIICPQGPGGFQDQNVGGFTLVVDQLFPYDAQSFPNGISVARLRTVSADYSADIDINSPGGLDPNTLWATKFRAHCITAMQTKLNATNILVLLENPRVNLTANRLMCRLVCLARGGNVLSCSVSEEIERVSRWDPRPRADGTPDSYFFFRKAGSKRLIREGRCEYVAGTAEPVLFGASATASGTSLTDTGQTADENLDAQEQDSYAPKTPGWHCERGRPRRTPTTRGDANQLQTVMLVQSEEWVYVANVEQAPVGNVTS